MSKIKTYRGYGCSAIKRGDFIPQRIQNMMIRQYVTSLGARFLLSAFEYKMSESYMMLRSLLNNLNDVDGVVFFTLNQLPDDQKDRQNIYDMTVRKNKELHFALEQIAITSVDDLMMLEDVMAVRKLTMALESNL